MTTLSKKAKETILRLMEDMSEINTEDVMELIEPHFMFDANKAKEQAIRRKANNLMAQIRDIKGIRKCFAYDDVLGTPKYVNIDTNQNWPRCVYRSKIANRTHAQGAIKFY